MSIFHEKNGELFLNKKSEKYFNRMNRQQENSIFISQENQTLIKVNPDTLIAYKTYGNKLKSVRRKLDSLDNIHEEINGKLKDLKHRSELIRKEQQRADLINGGIVVIIAVLLIKIIHSKVRSKKRQKSQVLKK